MSNYSTEQDTRIKDVVLQTLSSSGVMADVKARIDAEVFKALAIDLQLDWGADLEDHFPKVETFKRIESLFQTEEGLLMLFLVKDTLEKLGLKYTSSIFKTETSWETNSDKTNIQIYEVLRSLQNNVNAQDSRSSEGTSGISTNQNLPNDNMKHEQSDRPILFELIQRVMREDFGTLKNNGNSFSNETFVKSLANLSTHEDSLQHSENKSV